MLTMLFAVTVALAGPMHPVNVTTCDPRENKSRTYVGASGWLPAPYPGNPFYWNDVYGYRYYQPPFVSEVSNANPMLAIDYSNATEKTMSQVEFGLLVNGNLVAEVRDVGKFSPGIEIKHEFGISRNVFPIQTSLPHCIPLRITYEDGTKWVNPHLPALQRKLYGYGPR
jgi:hypothetical protein